MVNVIQRLICSPDEMSQSDCAYLRLHQIDAYCWEEGAVDKGIHHVGLCHHRCLRRRLVQPKLAGSLPKIPYVPWVPWMPWVLVSVEARESVEQEDLTFEDEEYQCFLGPSDSLLETLGGGIAE